MPIFCHILRIRPEWRIPVKAIYTGIALWMQDREEKAGKAKGHMLSLSLDRREHSGAKIILSSIPPEARELGFHPALPLHPWLIAAPGGGT